MTTDMQQFLSDVRTYNVAEFAGVSDDHMRRADIQCFNDGRIVVTLCVDFYAAHSNYEMRLECEPHTQTALLRAWQHVARAAEVRAIHGRTLHLLRASLGVADHTAEHGVAHIPSQHFWCDRALSAGFVSPTELALYNASNNVMNMWAEQHPNGRVEFFTVYDKIMSFVVNPLKIRLLRTPNSDAARAIAACRQAHAEYVALQQQDNHLRNALRRRCGLPLVAARYWLVPDPNDDVLALDDTLATLLA
jgi:hypothetical protein